MRNFLLPFLIAVFSAYFLFVSFSRHNNFYSRRLDLGNMNQTVWNVAHGNGFTLTDPMGVEQESRLAVHADFLLIVLAPLYRIWSDPRMLLLVQTVVVALGAIPVYWIANDKLRSRRWAMLFSTAYLLYPPLERMVLHDFHAEALSMTFLLFAYWYMYKQKYLGFFVFAVLAALGKEQIWLVTALMGGYIFLINRRRALGTMIVVISGAVFYLLFWKVIPTAAPTGQHFALAYLSEFGSGINDIVKNIITNPVSVLKDTVAPDRITYYIQLFAPLGFLSLLSPIALIFAAPALLINVLSNNGLLRIIDYQYTSTITPFLFISAIEGIPVAQRLLKWLKRKKKVSLPLNILPIGLSVTVLAGVFLMGELPVGAQSRFHYFLAAQPETPAMQQVEQEIDSRYSVSATNNIGAHFSGRQLLYNFPVNAEVADYSVVELGDPYAWPSGDDQQKAVDRLLQNSNYRLVAQSGTFYAFKKVAL